MRKNNKLLAGVLVVLLFFVTVSLKILAFAENTVSSGNITVSDGDSGKGGTEEGDKFVDRVTLWDSEGNEVTGEVSLAKQYRLRYDLISPLRIKIHATDVCMTPYMEKGIEYILPGISDDFIDYTGSFAVKAVDSNGDIITVATVEIGIDGIPVFIVDTNLDKGSLLNGYFEVTVNLNRETIGESEEYTLELPKGGSMGVEITENKKLPPTVSKEAVEYDPDSKMLTWRITVQNPANTMEELYPLRLSDVIGQGQDYVEGSFQVITPDGLESEEFENSVNQLTWLCSDAAGEAVIQYEYQTHVDVLELLENDLINEGISVLAQNTLSVAGADGTKLVDNIKASQTITGKTPVNIEKSGGQIIYYREEEDTAEIEWTITFTVNDYEIRELTVYDYFEAGRYPVRLKEEPVCEPQDAVNGRGYDSAGGSNNGKPYLWSYHIGDVSGNVTFIITYTTVIENYSQYVKKNNGISPRNQAWFDFDYPMGDDEPPKEFYGPVITVDVDRIHANILEKTGVYDPATHRITWTVIANPNQIQLPNAEITDRIPDGQRYIDSVVTIADGVEVTTTTDEENHTVTFSFGRDGLNGRTAVITLVTELEDSEAHKWANNWSGILKNDVTLYADTLEKGGVSDTGSASAESRVIAKELGAFNYVNHTIPVTITINQNDMELTGVTVADRLSDFGLELAEEKGIQINGITLKEGTEASRPSYHYNDGVLEIYPAEKLTAGAVITFVVRAADEYMYAHRSESVIGFENTAVLTSDQYGDEVRVQDTEDMTNRPIVKNGILNNQTGVITYTVEFNRTLADLPAGIVLTDTLPDGLLLKQSTIRLWTAEVDRRTGAMTKTSGEATGYTSQIYVSGTDTVLKISLPGGKQAYILEYDAQIVDKEKAPFVNRAVVGGYTGDGVSEGSFSFSKAQAAGARLENLIYIRVKKVDATEAPLAGAVFALMQGDKQLLIGSTKADGYLTFAGVYPNTEYTIVELQAPEGYVQSFGTWTFVTGSEGGVENAIEGVFVNREENSKEDGGETQPNDSSGNGTSSGDNSGVSRPERDNGKSNSVDMASPESKEEQGLDRLPRTGGFWGSGLMYGVGALLAASGYVILRLPDKKAFRCGCILLASGVLLLAGTFICNVHDKWRNAREVADFEMRILLPEVTPQQNTTNTFFPVRQKKEETPRTVQELQDENGVFAVLSISSISCKETIKEGCGSEILAKALGHMEETALPGEKGNCVIAGHRNYSFGLHFNRLNEVEEGDEITITTKEGVYTYIVTETKVVRPEEISVLNQTEEARLTLITCSPIYIATHRLVVVAELKE